MTTPRSTPPADHVVVGAGIVGLAVARELSLRTPDARIVVIDKEDVVAAHQTGHNSGVVHGGIYYRPGSLKARLCVEGARLMYEYCAENAVPHDRCGKLIVALSPKELGSLDELERRGHANEVPGLRRVGGADISDIEPRATGIAALHAPNTGIVDYAEVCRALQTELTVRGVEFRLGTEVSALLPGPHGAFVSTGRAADPRPFPAPHGAVVRAGSTDGLHARRVMVCAGLWADRLARRSRLPANPRIVPFRGAYLRLRPSVTPVVNGMIYPVPDPELPFLGVHVTRHIDGNVLLGPTAMAVAARDGYRLTTLRPRDLAETLVWPGTWRVARQFWRTGAHEIQMAASKRAFVKEAARYVPGLTVGDLDGAVHAGVRAQAVDRNGTLVDDFVIDRAGPVTVVRNAPSPAATSAFALAREILRRSDADGGSGA